MIFCKYIEKDPQYIEMHANLTHSIPDPDNYNYVCKDILIYHFDELCKNWKCKCKKYILLIINNN